MFISNQAFQKHCFCNKLCSVLSVCSHRDP